MQRLVVRAVGDDELLDTVGRERAHLLLEPRAADRGHQLVVGRLESENLLRGVPHRREDDRAGIDDRAVEIEENDGTAHLHRS